MQEFPETINKPGEQSASPSSSKTGKRGGSIDEKKSTSEPTSSTKPIVGVGLFSWKILGLVVGVLALGYAIGSSQSWLQYKPSAPSAPEGLAALSDSAIPLQPGPWGNLEATPIYIEPPDEYLPTQLIEEYDRRWRFTGISKDQLLALFQSADLTSDQRAELSNVSKWQQDSKAIYVSPSKELILSLSPKARKRIYEPMMADPSTIFNWEGQMFPADRFNDYFANCGLPDETVELIKKLSFPYGNLVAFCDIQLVLDTLNTPGQKTRLVKTLLRKATLLLRLHITPDSDLNALEHYWIRAGWGLDLRPMLESLDRLPKGARIDVVELLPPIPSADIYTYPFPSFKPEDIQKDCRWTSLNFFRETPDDRFTDPKAVHETLMTDYYPALSDPRYGDLVLLTKPNGDIIHIAVYIAAGIVYTKNSGSFRDPYILMTLPDMVDHFSAQIPENQKLGVQYLRNKYY